LNKTLPSLVSVAKLKTETMKNIFLLIALIFIGSYTVAAQQKLTADAGKTKLQWLGEKVTGEHTGTINLKDGWLNWKDNRIVAGEFNIDMTTIKDADASERLEGHLKSEDFFGVEKFPTSKLVITGSESFEKGTAVVKGTLSIKGVTHPVEFKATSQKKDDGTWFYANIVVDRSKYNIRYGSGSFFDNLGDKVIYDEFKLKVNLLVI
jgi:polyisoprenoid-binding protein YceI